jgi:hypothetical protein
MNCRLEVASLEATKWQTLLPIFTGQGLSKLYLSSFLFSHYLKTLKESHNNTIE